MTGPTGFVDRLKGKWTQPVGSSWIAGVQVVTNAYDVNTSQGYGQVLQASTSSSAINMGVAGSSASFTVYGGGPTQVAPAPLPASGILRLIPQTSAVQVITLPNPTAGCTRIIQYSTLNGATQILIKVATGTVTIEGTYGGINSGSSLTNTMKSTISCTIELYGLSTTQYAYGGVTPTSSGLITFSTTT